MINRKKLLKMSIYDLLCEMNKAITGFKCDCVMEALTGFKITYCCDSCGECIARWLNEEA